MSFLYKQEEIPAKRGTEIVSNELRDGKTLRQKYFIPIYLRKNLTLV